MSSSKRWPTCPTCPALADMPSVAQRCPALPSVAQRRPATPSIAFSVAQRRPGAQCRADRHQLCRAMLPIAKLGMKDPLAQAAGLAQTFAKVFSKVAVIWRKAESRRKLRAELEPRATVLYGREKICLSRLKNVQFLEKSRAARARKPDPHLKITGFLSETTQKVKTLPK
jgi:hypothetical protein